MPLMPGMRGTEGARGIEGAKRPYGRFASTLKPVNGLAMYEGPGN